MKLKFFFKKLKLEKKKEVKIRNTCVDLRTQLRTTEKHTLLAVCFLSNTSLGSETHPSAPQSLEGIPEKQMLAGKYQKTPYPDRRSPFSQSSSQD